MEKKEISFSIEKHLGTLSTSSNNWSKEVNLVSWNGRKAKIDIREWDENHEKMGKGLTLNENEMEKLKEILQKI